MASLELFDKKPLGGMDIREMGRILKDQGQQEADAMLERQLPAITPQGISLPEDHVVLLLGGSNGILRAVAMQLLFGEKIPVYAVHYDRKMMIGQYHVDSITRKAQEYNVDTRWWNTDATDPEKIQEVIGEIAKKYKVVHLINGIAAGATKRYEEHGSINVPDLDVAFHPVLQYPDFSSLDNIRQFGVVEVPLANEKDIERTNHFMGNSTMLWVKPLAEAGLLREGVSRIAFADYDFEKDDPVYGMGPLAGAKILQRESMDRIREQFKVPTVRLCYPAMDTTAIGAIPGGILMFAMSTLILHEKGRFKNLAALAEETMGMFTAAYEGAGGEMRLDDEFQKILPEMHRREAELDPAAVPAVFEPLTRLELP